MLHVDGGKLAAVLGTGQTVATACRSDVLSRTQQQLLAVSQGFVRQCGVCSGCRLRLHTSVEVLHSKGMVVVSGSRSPAQLSPVNVTRSCHIFLRATFSRLGIGDIPHIKMQPMSLPAWAGAQKVSW
jgi:hypothetical protein